MTVTIVAKKSSLPDGMRLGKCWACGDEKRVPIFVDNKLCDDCDVRWRFCSVCRRWRSSENRCRHVYEDQNLEWRGAGIGVEGDEKQALFKLFDHMPPRFPIDLRKAIRSQKFHTWLIAPLIGSGGILELHGMIYRDNRARAYGDRMLEIGGGEHAEETADGYRWLASLYNDKTLKANRATNGWIGEYLRAKAGAP